MYMYTSKVKEIFKKGDPAQCCNYRPISLLNLAYKVLASLLLLRLKNAEGDNYLWHTQFGFRGGHGTADALFIVRRCLETVWNSQGQSKILVALDWAKAFDSISPDGLLEALARFGLPGKFAESIRSIYSNRAFVVEECGVTSTERKQAFGISQGCPLSPYR